MWHKQFPKRIGVLRHCFAHRLELVPNMSPTACKLEQGLDGPAVFFAGQAAQPRCPGSQKDGVMLNPNALWNIDLHVAG